MQVEVTLPKIGMAMQDGVLVAWLKKEGDFVRKGEPLFEMETEKVVETVTSTASGIVEKLVVSEGDTVDVDSVVAIIRVEAEEPTLSAAQPAATAPVVTLESTLQAESSVSTGLEDRQVRLNSTTPLSHMRKTISRRMTNSLRESAQLTLMTEVDVTATVAKRENSLKQQNITYTDLFVSIVASMIERFPMLNGRLDGEKIVIDSDVNIGVAVALPEGLVVPVIRNANQKSLPEIAIERKRLVEAARAGDYTNDDLSGGTFTITNLGNYGIDLFTPIINLPEVAILGIGRIIKKPVVVDDQVEIRSMMGLSLTIDHRIVDGAPGAEFLSAISDALNKADF